MSQEAKVIIAIGIATMGILAGAIYFFGQSSSTNTLSSSTTVADQNILVREDSNKIGNPSAKVTLVEFADYQCPACAAAHPIIKRITDEYKDQMLFVYRYFPLPQHTNAVPTAMASEASGVQGKYWEMYDLLYKNQNQWSESKNSTEIFSGYAKDLGLDLDKFEKDIQSDKFTDKIQRDKNDGRNLGVSATPTFFLNGQKLVGITTYDELKNKIEQLTKAESPVAN